MEQEAKDFTEKDLVMLRLPNDLNFKGYRQPHYNTWFRVMLVDTNGTFIGRCERIDEMDFKLYKKGEIVRLEIEKVLSVYDENDGKQWCYSDGITRCNCPGLCRNK